MRSVVIIVLGLVCVLALHGEDWKIHPDSSTDPHLQLINGSREGVFSTLDLIKSSGPGGRVGGYVVSFYINGSTDATEFLNAAKDLGFRLYWDNYGRRRAIFYLSSPMCYEDSKRRLYGFLTLVDYFSPISYEIKQVIVAWLEANSVSEVFQAFGLVNKREFVEGLKQYMGPHWDYFSLDGAGGRSILMDCAEKHPVLRVQFEENSAGCFDVYFLGNENRLEAFDLFISLLEQSGVEFGCTLYLDRVRLKQPICFPENEREMRIIFKHMDAVESLTTESWEAFSRLLGG